MEKLKELFTSRKFIVTLAAVAGVTLLAALGRIEGAKALEFAQWVIGAWVVAQAGTDATKLLKK